MLLVVFLLAFVEVANSVVYSWILSVNPVDTDEGKQSNSPDNNTKGNSTVQGVSRKIKCQPCIWHELLTNNPVGKQDNSNYNWNFSNSTVEKTDSVAKENIVTSTTVYVMLASQ